MARHKSDYQSIPPKIIDQAESARRNREEWERKYWDERVKVLLCERALNAYNETMESMLLGGRNTYEIKYSNNLDLIKIYDAILQAFKGLKETGRLAQWERVSRDGVYKKYCPNNWLELTRPTYDWARELFNRACNGSLSQELFCQTWNTVSLRYAILWLHIFVLGLGLEHDGYELPKEGDDEVGSSQSGVRDEEQTDQERYPIGDDEQPYKYPIPPEFRTIPLNLKKAARLLGYTHRHGQENGPRVLSDSITKGVIPAEKKNRQCYVFDRRHFPHESQDAIKPEV